MFRPYFSLPPSTYRVTTQAGVDTMPRNGQNKPVSRPNDYEHNRLANIAAFRQFHRQQTRLALIDWFAHMAKRWGEPRLPVVP